MGSFAGHVLPGGMLLFLGLWWGIKFSMFQLTQKNKNRKWQLISRSNQRRLEIFEGFILIVFASVGKCYSFFAHIYSHKFDMMNLQHCTIFMFFELAGAMTLLVHTTEAVPLALDRLVLGLAFLNKGMFVGSNFCSLGLFLQCCHVM
uniref:Transmembrane protein 45B n=1 Tax=Periophthalmus magnuspinnatus TaxID=409849 RepID=A0A3B4B999_9GOBI